MRLRERIGALRKERIGALEKEDGERGEKGW